MRREMSDTEKFETLQEEIEQARKLAWDQKTASRCFKNLEIKLNDLPTEGEIFDQCRLKLRHYAIDESERLALLSVQGFEWADKMEKNGIRPID